MQQDLQVTNDMQARRYVARLDGEMAVLDYQFKAPVIIFTHIEVPRAMRGAGIAGQVARAALEDSRQKGYQVAPLCPYVASYIRRHREFEELVPEEYHYLVRKLPGRDGGD